MADDSPTDTAKKWWWLVAVAVPVAVAIIAILPDMIRSSNGGGGDTFRVIGSQFNDEVTFNTFNVVMDQAGQAGIELSEPELTTLRQALDLLQERRFDAAIPLLESLEQAVPVPAVLNNLGAAYLATGSTNQAKSAFDRALSEAPDQESARANLTKIDVEADPEPEPVKEVVKTKVKVSAVLAEGGPTQVSNFVIYEKGLDEYGQAKLNRVSYGNGEREATFSVPAGSYVLHAKHANAFAQKEIVIEAGKSQVLQLVYHAGRVKVSAVLAESGPVLVSNFVIYNQELDEYGQAKLNRISYGNGEREVTFTVPAGSYVLHAKHANAFAQKEIVIEAGKSQVSQLVYHAGRVKVSAVLAEGGPVQVSNFVIYNQGLDEYGQAKLNRVSYGNGEREVTFTVPAGSYVLHAKHANAFAEKEIVIEEGKSQVSQLVYHAGRVKVSAVLAESGPAQVSNFVIYNKGLDEYGQAKLNRVSYNNGELEATFTVPAGSYVLHAKHANASGEKEITISEGANQIVQIILQN